MRTAVGKVLLSSGHTSLGPRLDAIVQHVETHVREIVDLVEVDEWARDGHGWVGMDRVYVNIPSFLVTFRIRAAAAEALLAAERGESRRTTETRFVDELAVARGPRGGIVDQELSCLHRQFQAIIAVAAAPGLTHLVLRHCLNDGNVHTLYVTSQDRRGQQSFDCGELFEIQAFGCLINFNLNSYDAEVVLNKQFDRVSRCSALLTSSAGGGFLLCRRRRVMF